MAKRKPTEPIQPFPAEINRDYFAAWLSGFTDGEGCFALFLGKIRSKASKSWRCPSASLNITLRHDDAHVISLIHSFFDCGNISSRKTACESSIRRAPQITFKVSRTEDIINRIIPHFDKYPLLAKKRHDYATWREGVLMIWAAIQRPPSIPKEWWKGTQVVARRTRRFRESYEPPQRATPLCRSILV